MLIKIKDKFIPIILFLSGVTAQFPIEVIHSIITYLFAVYSLYILLFAIIKKTFVFNRFLFGWIAIWIVWITFSGAMSNYRSHIYMPLIRTYMFFIVILATYQFVSEMSKIEALFSSIKWIGIILSLSIILDFLFSGARLFDGKGELIRYTGLYTGENAAGYVLAVGAVIVLYGWINKKENILYALFILLGIILTGSRSAMIILFGASFFMYVGKRLDKKVFFSIIVGLSGILFVCLVNINLFYKLLRIDRGNAGRTELWETAIKVIHHYPVFGCGISCLPLEAYKYLGGDRSNAFMMARLNDAHNLYLTTAAELGYVGLSLLILILFYVLFVAIKNNKKLQFLGKYNIYKLILSFTLAFLVRALFEGNGIISKGWIGIDIYMWVFIIIVFRFQEIINESSYY